MDKARLALFSVMLAMGGLPLYIHLPQYVSTDLGVSLATLGVILVALRLFDIVQDPLIGRALDRFSAQLPAISMGAGAFMAIGFIGVFVLRVSSGEIVVLTLSSLILFTGYSTLYILLYRQSSAMNLSNAPRIRELGLLIGVILGAVAPFAFARMGLDSYQAYGILLAVLTSVACGFATPLWRTASEVDAPISWQKLRDIGATKLLGLVFMNSLPVGITSTLFLFFVSDRLHMGERAGVFLALFFIGTMFGVVVFSRALKKYHARKLLLLSMSGAILCFLWAYFLPSGAWVIFALICIASGIFLGGELYILPVLFARLLQNNRLQIGAAFGAWSFLSKLGLAVAAALVLPALGFAGYRANTANDAHALAVLAAGYALLPSLLKIGAIALVLKLPKGIMS